MSTTSSGPDPTPKKWQLLLLLRRPRRRAFPSFFYFFPKRLQQLKEKTFLILFVLTIGLASLFGLPAAAAAFLAADDRCINKNSFLFLFRFSVKNDKRWCSSLLPICFDRNLFQHPRLSRFRTHWQSRTSRFSRRRRVERGYSFSHLTIKSWSEKCHVATFKCFFSSPRLWRLNFSSTRGLLTLDPGSSESRRHRRHRRRRRREQLLPINPRWPSSSRSWSSSLPTSSHSMVSLDRTILINVRCTLCDWITCEYQRVKFRLNCFKT